MRRVLFGLGVLVILALALPALNLIVARPSRTALTTWGRDDPDIRPVAAMFEKSCANCHSTEDARPVYGGFPIARSLIQRDQEDALQAFDLTADLLPGIEQPIQEAVLAKIEYQIDKHDMPPGRYRAMHWTAHLHESQRETIREWIGSMRAANYAPAEYPLDVRQGVIQPLPHSVSYDPAKAALGAKLYHDVRLSADNSISCASCHDLAQGGTDRQRFSKGIHGRRGVVNAPTTFNAALQVAQFWDGRAATLEDQAAGPPVNPVEMGSSWSEIIDKLSTDTQFVRALRAVYPEGFSRYAITDAIAEFERTLVTPNARFDQFLQGDVDALSNQERHGWDLFTQNGCQTCHVGMLLGGQSFEVMGQHGDYFGDRGQVATGDWGRFNVTRLAEDRHRFKVPTLRNVALTAPYLHDGSAADLQGAVRVMTRYQVGAALSQSDIDALAAFLTSLTGEYRGTKL